MYPGQQGRSRNTGPGETGTSSCIAQRLVAQGMEESRRKQRAGIQRWKPQEQMGTGGGRDVSKPWGASGSQDLCEPGCCSWRGTRREDQPLFCPSLPQHLAPNGGRWEYGGHSCRSLFPRDRAEKGRVRICLRINRSRTSTAGRKHRGGLHFRSAHIYCQLFPCSVHCSGPCCPRDTGAVVLRPLAGWAPSHIHRMKVLEKDPGPHPLIGRSHGPGSQ